MKMHGPNYLFVFLKTLKKKLSNTAKILQNPIKNPTHPNSNAKILRGPLSEKENGRKAFTLPPFWIFSY
jgi:hypothetical protein